jgi:hypothetical protein
MGILEDRSKEVKMQKQFDTGRYDLVDADAVRVLDYQFGRNKQGEREVWIERDDKGERFTSRLIVLGVPYPVRHEIYTGKCYILRERGTGRYWFLDRNDCGFWLQNDSLQGVITFTGDEPERIQEWIRDFTR